MKRLKLKHSQGLIIRRRKNLTFTPIAVQVGNPSVAQPVKEDAKYKTVS